jgi:hypothetical protein
LSANCGTANASTPYILDGVYTFRGKAYVYTHFWTCIAKNKWELTNRVEDHYPTAIDYKVVHTSDGAAYGGINGNLDKLTENMFDSCPVAVSKIKSLSGALAGHAWLPLDKGLPTQCLGGKVEYKARVSNTHDFSDKKARECTVGETFETSGYTFDQD